MVAGAVLWGIFQIGSRIFATQIGKKVALDTIKKGGKQIVKSTFKTKDEAKNAAKNIIKRGVADAKLKVGGKGLDKAALAANRAKTPWLNAKGVFSELDAKTIKGLTGPQAKAYREAAKASQKLKKAKTLVGNKRLADATVSPTGRALRRVANAPGYVSKTGGRLRGAGRLALLGAGAAQVGYEGGKLLRSDKDKDGEDTGEKKKNGKNGNGGAKSGSTTTARPASLKDKYEIAQNKHGKYSERAGKAWGKKHGIDISYDYPSMSADEMQEGLDKGTVSKKLYGKEGKLTQAERDEINERRDMRRGGSISADSYKLRKKSSKAKSGRVSKQTSWNY